MEHVEEPKSKYRTSTAIGVGSLELGLILGMSIVLGISSDDCAHPLRMWMIVLLCVLALHVLFLILAETVLDQRVVNRTFLGQAYLSVNCLVNAFVFVWIVLGNSYFYDCADSCSSDWYPGYVMILLIFIVYYIIAGVLLILLLVLLGVLCVGSYHINKYKKQYDQD